jgi:hypothetical protein
MNLIAGLAQVGQETLVVLCVIAGEEEYTQSYSRP